MRDSSLTTELKNWTKSYFGWSVHSLNICGKAISNMKWAQKSAENQFSIKHLKQQQQPTAKTGIQFEK